MNLPGERCFSYKGPIHAGASPVDLPNWELVPATGGWRLGNRGWATEAQIRGWRMEAGGQRLRMETVDVHTCTHLWPVVPKWFSLSCSHCPYFSVRFWHNLLEIFYVLINIHVFSLSSPSPSPQVRSLCLRPLLDHDMLFFCRISVLDGHILQIF